MKSKKMMALVTAAAMAFGLAGCGGGNTAATTAAPAEKAEEKTTAAEAVTEATEAAKSEGSDNWKVAILTGTVSQGEEEFRAAEKALAAYQNFLGKYESSFTVLEGDFEKQNKENYKRVKKKKREENFI